MPLKLIASKLYFEIIGLPILNNLRNSLPFVLSSNKFVILYFGSKFNFVKDRKNMGSNQFEKIIKFSRSTLII